MTGPIFPGGDAPPFTNSQMVQQSPHLGAQTDH